LKAKIKSQNARNDEPEPDFLTIEIPMTNIIKNIIQTKMLYSAEIVSKMKAAPRMVAGEIGNRKGMKTPWKFSLSVFKDYKSDN